MSAPANLRRPIETAIESLIALLDLIDGDPDIEEDDPAFDPADLGEPDMFMPLDVAAPAYGIDQSAGPTNCEDALDAWEARLGYAPCRPGARP